MIATACLIINIITKNQTPKQTKNILQNTEETTIQNEENENSDEEEIKTLSESSRMKRYIGNFFENIEEGKYQEAYNKLNEDFKYTYFPRLEDFEKYANKNFKYGMIGVTYDNIERWGNSKTGNMYVIWITTAGSNKVKTGNEEEKPQTNFVIIEKDYNNYEMSFSVNIDE